MKDYVVAIKDMPQGIECPFCRESSPTIETHEATDGTPKYFVHCKECECRGPDCADPRRALFMWNERYHDGKKLTVLPHEEKALKELSELLLKVINTIYRIEPCGGGAELRVSERLFRMMGKHVSGYGHVLTVRGCQTLYVTEWK